MNITSYLREAIDYRKLTEDFFEKIDKVLALCDAFGTPKVRCKVKVEDFANENDWHGMSSLAMYEMWRDAKDDMLAKYYEVCNEHLEEAYWNDFLNMSLWTCMNDPHFNLSAESTVQSIVDAWRDWQLEE